MQHEGRNLLDTLPRDTVALLDRKRMGFESTWLHQPCQSKMSGAMSMRCLTTFWFAAGVALVVSAMPAQEVGYLDLTDPAPRQRLRSPNGGTGGFCVGDGGDPKVAPEITLTLVSIDKQAYSLGEEVTFEVRIENTGKQSIELPWTPHLGDLEPGDSTQPYTYDSALVVLNFTDPDSHRAFSLGGMFYGSTRVAGSLRELQPRDSALIRTKRRLAAVEGWWWKKLREVQPLYLKASPGLMLSTTTYSPNQQGEPTSENSHCTLMKTKIANQLDVILWPSSSK